MEKAVYSHSTIGPNPLLPISNFSNEVMVDLTAGSTISLQLFGVIATADLLPGSSGASLTITRLS